MTLGFTANPNSCRELNIKDMERNNIRSSKLPHDQRKSAKRLLVKIAASDGDILLSKNKMRSKSSGYEEFKSKKMKSSDVLPNPTNSQRSEESSVLPSITRRSKQKIVRLPSQDDLWKSIKSNYFFLMDNNLINECQKTRKEFSLYSPPSSPVPAISQQPISFPQFVERFNILHDRLHSLQISLEGKQVQNDLSAYQSDKDRLDAEYTFLLDQASILQRLDPELKDDVGRRCTILKNKWELLESALWPKRKSDLDTGLSTEIRNIRKWLREVDEKLRHLKVTDKSSPEEIRNIFKEEKVLQREIEERGKEINSLIRLCESTADGATADHPPRFRRCVLHLERSWHHIWIRSLENQCLTEQHLLRHAATTTQSTKESSDRDSDEGPLRKHRRLKVDHWTAVSATMDRLKKEQTKRPGLRTRDVGVLCSERVPVNDKCIMVGTTGIAALKAEYGDDFTNFEIIQDVGYSSESSTHLSGDDTGLDQHFNVRIYKYTKDNQPDPLGLREEWPESVARLRNFHSLGSSLESSSSAAASLDDSGLGTGETLTAVDSGDVVLGQFPVEDDYGQEELDYLETVLDECIDFGANVASEQEELHFNLSGLDSDDPSDNFQNRSSFTTSAQKFYKMISVDSDNGETENNNNENNVNNNVFPPVVSDSRIPNTVSSPESFSEMNSNNVSASTATKYSANDTVVTPTDNNSATVDTTFEDHLNKNLKCTTSDSDPETFKPVAAQETCHSSDWVQGRPRASHRVLSSTPVRGSSDKCSSSRHHQGLKRKRDHDVGLDSVRMSSRVRSWLNRCSDFSIPSRPYRRSVAARASPDLPKTLLAEDISSCDASCECTSSSADEGNNNVHSSMSSFGEDDVFRQKLRLGGSFETVVHALLDTDFPFLLPPPPSSTASFGSGSKNCSTVCCRSKKREIKLKASSDGDLGKGSGLKQISKLPARHAIPKRNQSKADRLYSSLPSVLRHTSDSSTDDNFIPSTLPSHSDTRTVGGAHHSSSSDVGRRRRRRSRKKSSSSNRSSTSVLHSSSDRGRHRSRTVTSSTSRCGSRRRHVSQRSEYFCTEMLFSDGEKAPLKVEISPEEENVGFEELHRASSALLSPVESDVVLTHLEEQSTVSDQVWDGYQEMPYLSEGYSEATVDEDAVRKLTEFGDDYVSAIGLPLRLLDPPDTNNNKAEGAKSPKKSAKTLSVTPRVSSISDDSDSDSEDLYYVIQKAGEALHFARAILKRRQGGDSLTSADYAELLATCGTHLQCLQTICKHIDGKQHNFSASHLKQLHFLIEQWQILQRNTEMFEKSEDPARQKYLKAQENIDALYNKMSELASYSHLDIEGLASCQDIDKNMSRLQMVLTSLREAKEELRSVNLQVHRFSREYSSDANYGECSLKEHITELYRQWEDTYEQNGSYLTELESLKKAWEAYDDKFQNLRLRVKEAEFESNDDVCDTISINSIDTEPDRLRKDIYELRLYAAPFKDRLKGGDAWKKIEDELRDLEKRIDRQFAIKKRPAFPSENHRGPSSAVEDDADDHFEDAIQQMCVEDLNRSSLSTPQKKDVATAISPKRKRGRFWRIIRVAVPVQLALVLLYCIACYLEPGCCNQLNNFNFSFTPQLRYFGGRPPV